MVMCREPMTRAPASGFVPSYLARMAIRPGISCSARRISERPSVASLRSRTLNGARPAALAAAKGWVISRVAVMNEVAPVKTARDCTPAPRALTYARHDAKDAHRRSVFHRRRRCRRTGRQDHSAAEADAQRD